MTGALFSEMLQASNVAFGTATTTDFAGTVTVEPVSLIFSKPAVVPSAIITHAFSFNTMDCSLVALLINTAILLHSPATLFVS